MQGWSLRPDDAGVGAEQLGSRDPVFNKYQHQRSFCPYDLFAFGLLYLTGTGTEGEQMQRGR